MYSYIQIYSFHKSAPKSSAIQQVYAVHRHMPMNCWDKTSKRLSMAAANKHEGNPIESRKQQLNTRHKSTYKGLLKLWRTVHSTVTTQPMSQSMVHSLGARDAMTTKHQKSPHSDCTIYSNAATCRQKDIMVCFQGQPGQATMIKSVHQLSIVLQAANLIFSSIFCQICAAFFQASFSVSPVLFAC